MGTVQALSAASVLGVEQVESKDEDGRLIVTVKLRNFRTEGDILLLFRPGEPVHLVLAERGRWQPDGKLDPRTRFVVRVIRGHENSALLVFGFQFSQ